MSLSLCVDCCWSEIVNAAVLAVIPVVVTMKILGDLGGHKTSYFITLGGSPSCKFSLCYVPKMGNLIVDQTPGCHPLAALHYLMLKIIYF